MPKLYLFRAPGGFLPAACLLAAGVLQIACTNMQHAPDDAAEQSKPVQPGFFTVSAEQMAHLKVITAGTKVWQSTVTTTGTVDWDADRTTQAITQVNGPITRILVDMGAKVSKGDPLLYVSSPDVANAVSAYRKAWNREALAKRIVDRMHDLLDRGAVATKDQEGSEADYNDARTDVQTSLQALRIFGITQQQIDQAQEQGTSISTELAVRAPIAGVVVQKLVSPGMVIQAGSTVCFMLSDTSTVWVQGHIFDRDLPFVRTGDTALETNPASARTFRGQVNYVGAFVDPATRTTPVRIVTQNPDGLLKKDMFVEASIHTGSQANVLAVPAAAVLRDDKNEPIVYVQASPGKFAQRSVTIGSLQDGMIAITSGLQKGEAVLADGSVFVQFAATIQ
ncbi:MAG TPA: efflux RND transporter periplasmic adaptor subunit [Bryobacteraceae bacterium]|jgi:cobalt-zinc-cadmium efflux system membrane fusion protein|nr:efflux RND transporter periplasmic adaptor subunit [Bryobacteraceae bacterium]